MKKVFPLLLALVAMVLTGCGKGSSKPVTTEWEVEDNRPPIVVGGAGYQVALPAYANDVQCEPVSDEQEAKLERQGYTFIAKPLLVTQKGNEHVQLGQAATVSFAIPADFPEERYDELVGMLITDKGAEYKIPDYYALREGVVQFQTSHFSIAGAGISKDSLRERFIEEVAVNGWGRNMSNKSIEPTWREQLKKFADDHCLGENDLVGIAMREVFGDNDIVKIGMDIVNAHDMENVGLDVRIEVASQTMVKVAESKLLAYFLSALKEEESKDDDEKDESKRNKIIGVLEEHFNMDNVEQVSTLLGEKASVEKCYVYACEYVGKYALDQWKSKVEEMVPYIGAVKQTAQAVEIWKKFWAATQMQDLYKRYEAWADERHGLLSFEEWNAVSKGVAAPEFLHGMKDEKIKEMIEQRYLERVRVNEKKKEVRKYLNLIETCVDLNSPCFEDRHFDYVKRLTVVNNLMERFRTELVDKDGELVFNDEGYQRVYGHQSSIDEQLCYVINKYLEYYPNRDKFYEWLSQNGFNYGQLKKEYKKWDELLWTRKNNPDIHIVIGETLGTTGSAKYIGHTICLGTDGKPYKDWYRSIPDLDSIRDMGWSWEFPEENVDIKLSEYEAIGRPNQVLIYASEDAFLSGAAPVETVAFVVDTLNRYTYVELNKDNGIMMEFVFNGKGDVSYERSYDDGVSDHMILVTRMPAFLPKHAMEDALSDVHLLLNSKGDDFTFTTSGESSNDMGDMVRIDMTVDGHIDFEQGVGTCTINATVVADDGRGWTITAHYNNLTGKVEYDRYEGEMSVSANGTVRVEIDNKQDGWSSVAKPEGSIGMGFTVVE